jgi:hypothetical protein
VKSITRRIRCHFVVFPGDPSEDTPYSRGILKELIVRDAIVPEIWAFEITNNIFVSHRKRNRINEQQIVECLSLLKALPIRIEAQPLWTNIELESSARRWDLAACNEFLKRKALDEGMLEWI